MAAVLAGLLSAAGAAVEVSGLDEPLLAPVAEVFDSVDVLEEVLPRLSVMYHPDPLKITPLACSTRRTEPVQVGHVVIGSSEKF